MKYLIIATRDGVLSAEDFAQRLVSRWADAEVTQLTSPTSLHAMEFLIPMAHSHLNGSLNREGSCIAFEADLPDYRRVRPVVSLHCPTSRASHLL